MARASEPWGGWGLAGRAMSLHRHLVNGGPAASEALLTLCSPAHTPPRELPPSHTPPTHRGSLSPSPRKRETPRHRSQSLCLALPLPGALGRSSNPSEPQLPDLGNGHSLPTLSRMLLRKFRSQFQRACPLWGPDTREQWSVICHSWVVPPGSAGGGWVENPAETWVPHL